MQGWIFKWKTVNKADFAFTILNVYVQSRDNVMKDLSKVCCNGVMRDTSNNVGIQMSLQDSLSFIL